MIIESILGLALSIPADPGLKCPGTDRLPGYDDASPVVILDGRILGSAADFAGETIFSDGTIQPSDIAHVEHTCWDPESGELSAAQGVPAIVIGTFSGQAAARAETLAAADLVHAFVAEHGEVPTSPEQVDTSLAGYSIEVRDLGWVLKSPDRDGVECVTSQLGSEAEEATCSPTYSVVKQALRAAWERGAQAS